MKVELSGRGLREVAKARASWQAHREHAPRLLDDELDAAVELMSNQPLVGQVWRTAGGVEIRKLIFLIRIREWSGYSLGRGSWGAMAAYW